jgi:hypothetical protein
MVDEYGRRLLKMLEDALQGGKAVKCGASERTWLTDEKGRQPGMPPPRDRVEYGVPWLRSESADGFTHPRRREPGSDPARVEWIDGGKPRYDEIWREFFGHTFGEEFFTRDCAANMATIQQHLAEFGMPAEAAAFWAEQYRIGGEGWRRTVDHER